MTKLAVQQVRESLNLTPTGSLPSHLRPTLLLAATYADPDGSNVFPSAGTLGDTLGLARSTVSDHLQQLEALGVIVNTGERKSWTQFVNTAVRCIDFAALDALTVDALGRQPSYDVSERQPSETDDGETRRMTARRGTDDVPDRHNPPNPPLNQDGHDSAQASSPSPPHCPECDRVLSFKEGENFCQCDPEATAFFRGVEFAGWLDQLEFDFSIALLNATTPDDEDNGSGVSDPNTSDP